MLDASALSAVLTPLGVGSEFVQVSSATDNTPTSPETSASNGVAPNTPPSNLQIAPLADVYENDVAQLAFTFDDPDFQDTHTVEINWGDGTATETINLTGGERFVFTTHQYLDDNPTATVMDVNQVMVTVTDNASNSVQNTAPIKVFNVAPVIDSLSVTPSVNENGVASLQLSFTDPGSLDTHTVEIDWGDGTATETIDLTGGERFVFTTHQYLDDNPTGTPFDLNQVQVTVSDDDLGSDIAMAGVKVTNLLPTVSLDPVTMINENGTATLSGSISDVGTLDTFTLDINWGDPLSPDNTQRFALGNTALTEAADGINWNPVSRAFSLSHQYLDDNPSGSSQDTYTIHVKATDDDTGEGPQSTTVQVKNVKPTIDSLTVTSPITENDFAQLTLQFTDPGVLDTHTVDLDWGDGSAVETIVLSGGERFLITTHQYKDDNPSGTPSDIYTVKATVTDDDGGSDSAMATVRVNNFAPVIDSLSVSSPINENDVAQLTLQFTDPGTLDTHTVDIDWGDGSAVETIVLTGGERFVLTTHQYLDDNPSGTSFDDYQVKVTVTDDDSGTDSQMATVRVNNLLPTVILDPVAMINENEFATLSGQITDTGSLDTFTLEIDWGDPFSPPVMQTFTLGTTALTEAVDGINWDPNTRQFSLSHQYLDDNPSSTSQDTYTITAKATDDDTGMGTAQTTVTVKNLDLTLTLQPVDMINENGLAELTGSISDTGSLDTFEIAIDWGDPLSPDDMQSFVLGTTALTESADGINWDPTTRVFSLSHQYLDDNPTASLQDTYTITVQVNDDDMSAIDTKMTTVLVKNVSPELTFQPVAAIDENGTAVLEGHVVDPGTLDTFTIQLDWDDPLSPNNMQSFSLGTATLTEAADGINWNPTTRIFSLSHQYLDDNPTGTSQDTYTIAVDVTDDDTGMGMGQASVLVSDVSAVVTVDPVAGVIESGVASLSGSFTDVGTLDTHTAMVDWGDGTSSPAVLVEANGSGTFSATHQYLDNDADNVFTITVTVVDDDTVPGDNSVSVTVLNVDPSFIDVDPMGPTVIVATDVNTQGETTVTLQFTDAGLEKYFLPGGSAPFTVLVDWGDKLSVADPDARFVEAGTLTDVPSGPISYTHTYSGPPDPLHPAADITIRVKIRDDDFQTMTPLGAVGESGIEEVVISNPGIGKEVFRIDTTPQVPRLEFRREVQTVYLVLASPTTEANLQGADIRAVSTESKATTERILELRVVDAYDIESEGIRLKLDVLRNLPKLFIKLPDNHYRIYLIRLETNTQRLVIEVYVRNGKLIDRSDDTEGVRDRPPTDETHRIQEQPRQDVPNAVPSASTDMDAIRRALEAEVAPDSMPLVEPIDNGVMHQATPGGLMPVAAGLVATRSFSSWAQQVDRAVAEAGKKKWRQLRRRSRNKRKNR